MNKKIPSDSLVSRFRKRWPVILFSAVFAAVGLGFLLFGVIPAIRDNWKMETWEQHYARLLDAGIKVEHGDDTDTYRAFADYTYEFNGREYRGERVGIFGMSDNIGNFHQTIGAELKHARDQGTPVPVWINPDNPDEAVLNRDLRWGMILFQMVFVLGFGGVGLSLLLLGFLAPANKLPETALAMDPYPGSIGGQVGGTVNIDLPYQPDQMFKVTLGCLYSLVVSLKVTMDQQVLRTRKTIFGIPVGGKRASRQEIHHLRLHKSFSQPSGGKHKQFFKIHAVTNDDRKINIGRNLPGENVARQAMESIATLTGLDTDPAHRTEILPTHSR